MPDRNGLACLTLSPTAEKKTGAMHSLALALAVTCGLFVCSTLPAAAEDVTITFRVTYRENNPSIRYKYISPGMAEAWSGPDYGFISEATGKMIRIDHERREYYETTEQEGLAAVRLLLRRGIHRPPLISYSVSVEKLSDGRKIAGHDCEHYVMTTRSQDGDRTEPVIVNTHDYWIATDLPYLDLETFQARQFEMPARILQQGPTQMLKMLLNKGLILAETWSTANGRSYSEEAIDVNNESIDPSVFSAPAGYAEVESPNARTIRQNANVQLPSAGVCSPIPYMAVGGGDDEDAAWDATKKAWRGCVTESFGEGWTFATSAKKQCHPRENAVDAPQGTRTFACKQFGGDPNGKWTCRYEGVACKALELP